MIADIDGVRIQLERLLQRLHSLAVAIDLQQRLAIGKLGLGVLRVVLHHLRERVHIRGVFLHTASFREVLSAGNLQEQCDTRGHSFLRCGGISG